MQTSIEMIWRQAQDLLRSMLNGEIFNLWFSNIRAVQLDGDSITLEVANDFCELWLKDNYLGLLQDALTHVTGRALNIHFRVGSGAGVPPPPVAPKKAKAQSSEEVTRRLDFTQDLLLNPKYTFDTFVVGSSNYFAHAAALAVAQ